MLMRRHQQSKLLPSRMMLAMCTSQRTANIYTGIPKDNTDLIPEKMMEEETKAFKERVTEKNRDILAAQRLSYLRMQRDYLDDENVWWNKLRTMTEAEFKIMPMGFIKKYGSYITNLARVDKEYHMEENKSIYDYYTQVKYLKKLQTNEEKELMVKEFKRAQEPDIVTMAGLERERGDYMKRQPRLDINELSYNFEQYGRYTKLLARSMRKDKAKSELFYKVVKYVKKNKENEGDAIVRNFTMAKGFDPDLIEIPEEFADLPIADLKPKDFARKQSNKRLIRTRTAKNMSTYDAWRCHDRSVFTADEKHPNVAKFWIAPLTLRKVFGMPDLSSHGIVSTGEYNFEDNNLDCYKLFDYKQTDLFHGLSREDEYYTSAKNMRKPHHKRKRKYPTVTEFWSSEEPSMWKLTADEYADVPRFKRWFKAQLLSVETQYQPFEDHILAKYADKIDVCLGKWEEKGVINTEMAVHKLDASQYMTKEELKEYPHGPISLCVPPKMFDLNKAKLITMTKEELNLKQQREEAMKEAAAL